MILHHYAEHGVVHGYFTPVLYTHFTSFVGPSFSQRHPSYQPCKIAARSIPESKRKPRTRASKANRKNTVAKRKEAQKKVVLRKEERRVAAQMQRKACQHSHPHPFVNLEDRTNITITEESSGATILQRVSPTSLLGVESMMESCETGLKLKNALLKVIEMREGTICRKNDMDGQAVCHLGLSADGKGVDFSEDQILYKSASFSMLRWISDHSHYIRSPYLESIIAPDLFASIDGRAEQHRLLVQKLSNPEWGSMYFHRWWNTATVILDSKTELHTDTRFNDPSILLNFGDKVILEVDGSIVCLHPGDMAIYRASLPHRIRPANGKLKQSLGSRFAVLLRSRK